MEEREDEFWDIVNYASDGRRRERAIDKYLFLDIQRAWLKEHEISIGELCACEFPYTLMPDAVDVIFEPCNNKLSKRFSATNSQLGLAEDRTNLMLEEIKETLGEDISFE
jgi:hypothetical protein